MHIIVIFAVVTMKLRSWRQSVQVFAFGLLFAGIEDDEIKSDVFLNQANIFSSKIFNIYLRSQLKTNQTEMLFTFSINTQWKEKHFTRLCCFLADKKCWSSYLRWTRTQTDPSLLLTSAKDMICLIITVWMYIWFKKDMILLFFLNWIHFYFIAGMLIASTRSTHHGITPCLSVFLKYISPNKRLENKMFDSFSGDH